MGKKLTEERKEVIQTLLGLQKQYLKELKNIANPDHETVLIYKAKCIAIGQAIDELGYDIDEIEDKEERE